MLRAIAVLAAGAACALAGCSGAARLKRRYGALSEICAAMQRMQTGLLYTNETVAAMLGACGGGETRSLFAFLSAEIAKGETPLAAWERAVSNGDAALCALTQNDQKALDIFFSLLGGSDRCSQVQHITAARKTLAVQCAEAKRAHEKNGRMYCSMGVLLGVGVAILLL